MDLIFKRAVLAGGIAALLVAGGSTGANAEEPDAPASLDVLNEVAPEIVAETDATDSPVLEVVDGDVEIDAARVDAGVADAQRPALPELVRFVHEDDVVVMHSKEGLVLTRA